MGWRCGPTAPTSSRRIATWLFCTARCNCWNRWRPAGGVQHLAPDHKSILTDLIRRYTRMQVFEVEDGMAFHPNSPYTTPPNRDMAFLHGTLQLLEPCRDSAG